MSKQEPIIKLTESELKILRILWEKDGAAVSTVHAELSKTKQKSIVYTTTLKLMQIMHEKGLVQRDTSKKAHIYSAAVKRTSAQKQLLKRMVHMVFADSMGSLALHAIGEGNISKKELLQIKKLIAEQEKKK